MRILSRASPRATAGDISWQIAETITAAALEGRRYLHSRYYYSASLQEGPATSRTRTSWLPLTLRKRAMAVRNSGWTEGQIGWVLCYDRS